MALSIFNWNGATPISVSGNYIPIISSAPQLTQQGSGQNGASMIYMVTYYVSGGTATGNITFQELAPDRVTWLLLATPASIALSANPANGSIQGPFLGVRMVVGSLAVSTIATAMLKGTILS